MGGRYLETFGWGEGTAQTFKYYFSASQTARAVTGEVDAMV